MVEAGVAVAAGVAVMAEVMATTASLDPDAGGTSTAFGSAGIIDTGPIHVRTNAIQNLVRRATGAPFYLAWI